MCGLCFIQAASQFVKSATLLHKYLIALYGDKQRACAYAHRRELTHVVRGPRPQKAGQLLQKLGYGRVAALAYEDWVAAAAPMEHVASQKQRAFASAA